MRYSIEYTSILKKGTFKMVCTKGELVSLLECPTVAIKSATLINPEKDNLGEYMEGDSRR